MGVIKREQIQDKGVVYLNKPPAAAPVRREKPPVPVFSEPVQANPQQVARARNEAEQIVAAAMQEAEGIREEAREAGHQEGRAEAVNYIEETMATLNNAVKERKKIIQDAEQEILRLSLKVAEQIIKSEVSLHRDVCLNIVAEAIARVSDREQIIVKVNREDAEYLKRYKDRLASMMDGVKSFSIIEDGNVEPGGCLIETNLGFIDARIPTKLASIEEALRKVSSTSGG